MAATSQGSVTYAPPIRRLPPPTQLDYDLLEAADDLAGDGRAVEAIGQVLAHLFPSAEIGDLTTTPFTFVQGSSLVTVRIEDGELAIAVPLATLSADGNPVAALRYVLTRVSAPGQIYQPRLRGDALSLEFRDKLTRMHPAKVLDVLRRMPPEADRVDDWLVGEFGAVPLGHAEIERLTDDEAARAYELWTRHWGEVEGLLAEAQRKRSVWFLNEVTAFANFRIRFALPLCGHLGSRLAESSAVWNDGQVDSSKREAALARCLRDMKAVTADELRANLGHASYALSPLSEGRAAIISDYFAQGGYIEQIDRFRKSGHSFEAGLALVSTYTYLLARFAWPPVVATAFMEGLAEASGKPWREAATLLWNHCKGLVARFCGDDAEGGDDAEEEEPEGGDEGEDGDAATDGEDN
ncbi:MAG: hypothetical protein H6709_17405 [Kofleriaceae bacterium]|nr:hypothetical protein [Kofleriaceae bacterium]MCB9573860.1 hypothetical protein [Kofleriaceae bacterium]